MFMDTATDFGGSYTPSDADNLERGPVRVRNALQFSLNIPSVKATAVNTPDAPVRQGEGLRDDVPDRQDQRPGLSIALGVQEVRPVDLSTAYGTLANGGKKIAHTTILSVKDQSGTDVGEPITSRRPATRWRRPRRPSSSPTSWPATRTRRSTRSGASSRSTGPGNGAGRRPSRPARTTTPRTSTRTASSRRRPTAAGRRASTPSPSAPGTATATTRRRRRREAGLLDRRHDLRLAGLPAGGDEEVGDQRLRGPGRHRPGEDRPVHRR